MKPKEGIRYYEGTKERYLDVPVGEESWDEPQWSIDEVYQLLEGLDIIPLTTEEFWGELNEENKNKAAEICEGYNGSDGVRGRILELWEESNKKLNANEYIRIYYENRNWEE